MTVEAVQLYDFKGYVNRKINPMNTPRDVIIEGKNILLADGGIKARKGMAAIGIITGTVEEILNLGFNNNLTDSAGEHVVEPGLVAVTYSADTKYAGTHSLLVPHTTDFVFSLASPASLDWWLARSGGISDWIITIYIYRTTTDGVSIAIAGQEGDGASWSFSYDGMNAELRFGIAPGGFELVGDLDLPIEEWWRLQAERNNGAYILKAQKASLWDDTGTIAGEESDVLIPELADSPLILLETDANHDADCYVDNLTISRGATVPIRMLQEVRFPSSEAKYLLAQSSEGKLLASNTQLPSSAITFDEIYDLGADAGLCSVAVLGDRAVITEGVNEQPLVFPGGLADDGSDWASPKAVLISYNGGNDARYEDITQDVCDADPLTSAQVGGMGLNGEIIIISDFPKVAAIRIEMETVNEGIGGTAEFTETSNIAATTDYETLDLGDGLITQWVQDNGVDGHFEGTAQALSEAEACTDEGGGLVGLPTVDSPFTGSEIIEVRGSHVNFNGTRTVDASSTATKIVITATYTAHTVGAGETATQRITLGAGNNCPDVEAGLVVNFADASVNILAIADDGEADEEVSLQTAHESAAIASITAVVLDTAGFHLAYGNAGETAQIYTKSLTSGDANCAAWSLRIVILGADLTATGVNPVFEFLIGAGGATCTHASIVEQDSGPSGTETPTELTFGGQSGFSGAEGDVVRNDTPAYTCDSGKNYIVTLDMAYTSIQQRSPAQAEKREDPKWRELTNQINALGAAPPSQIQETQWGPLWVGGSSYGWVQVWVTNPAYTTWYNQYMSLNTARNQISQYYWYEFPQTVTTVATGALATGIGTGGYYYKAGTEAAPAESWDQDIVSGFTLQSGKTIAIQGIWAVTAESVIPAQAGVICTTDDSRMSIGHIDAIEQIRQAATSVGVKWIALSFDKLATLTVFKSGAWREICRNNGTDETPDWEYKDGADAWQNATRNSMLGAWRQAGAIAANQMSAEELQAITQEQSELTGGFVPHVTTTLDRALYMQASGGNIPTDTGFVLAYLDTGSAIVDAWQGGAWTEGDGWTDGTQAVEGIPLGQDGNIEYTGGYFEADYGVHSEVHGFAFRLRTQGTSAGTAITKIRVKGPCQPLATIAANTPDYPLAFIVVDSSAGTQHDYAVEMSDGVTTDLSCAPIPLGTDDEIAITGLTEFSAVEITPLIANTNAALASLSYWDGTSRKALTMTDGSLLNGKSFAAKGKLEWTIPDDWKPCIPYAGKSERGYTIWLKVSATLSATASISECRLYSVPKERPKYQYAATMRDRLALLSRTDNRAQADISRSREEYGFVGGDSQADENGLCVGGGRITAAFEAWGSLFVSNGEDFYQYKDGWMQKVSAAGLTPINSRCVIKAPMSVGDAFRYSLLYLSTRGVYAAAQLNADENFGTATIRELTQGVNWFDPANTTGERIDLNYLYLSDGAAWLQEGLACWLVPMIAAGGTEQTTLNCMIVCDLTLGAWLPPFYFAVPFSCLCVASTYNATAPGKLGPEILLAGGYDGKIYRLFYGDDDDGTPIEATARQRVTFGRQTWLFRYFSAYGYGNLGSTIKAEIYRNGEQSSISSEDRQFDVLINPAGKDFTLEPRGLNVEGNFFEILWTLTGQSQVYGEAGFQLKRDPFV